VSPIRTKEPSPSSWTRSSRTRSARSSTRTATRRPSSARSAASDFDALNLTNLNSSLQGESSGEPASGKLYSEDKKNSYGIDDSLTNYDQPEVDYQQAVLIDELELEDKVLWWEGDDPVPDEGWVGAGVVAFGHELYDNNSDGNAEYRTGYHYQVYLEGIQDNDTAEHRRAVIAYNQMWDKDEDNHTEDVVGAMGYLETYDNDTDGHDEYQAAIWIVVNQKNVTLDGNPQYNESFIVGVEQEYAATSDENPVHTRAVIGHAVVTDEDMDGNPEHMTATAAAMEMYDNNTDGEPTYLGVILFGTELIDEDDDGNPETNNTYIWILEVSDDDSDGTPDRLWAVITMMQSWDNDTDGEAEEANAMQAGCLKIDADNDGNDEHVKIYVAGGKVRGDNTDWFVWYHEGNDPDDDGEVDDSMSFALYHKNHTDEQNIITAVQKVDGDHEVLFFGLATTVDADEDGNNEREEGVTWLMESDGSEGVKRGVIWHVLKVDEDSDGNFSENTTTLIGFQSEDDDGDGTPERQRLLIIRFAQYDNNSNGFAEHKTSGAIGAYIEGNGTYPQQGYLYVVHGEAWDQNDNGTETNRTIYLGGYVFRNNNTDEQKDYEALKFQAIVWNDENGDGVDDESEKDYSVHFGARVNRS
jgi:predicted Mrr-cat superfamily restriction endonuclease